MSDLERKKIGENELESENETDRPENRTLKKRLRKNQPIDHQNGQSHNDKEENPLFQKTPKR